MAKKLFTIAKNDKKTRKKAIELLDKEENLIDALEVFGGKNDDFNMTENWIQDQVSTQINAGYQSLNDFI